MYVAIVMRYWNYSRNSPGSEVLCNVIVREKEGNTMGGGWIKDFRACLTGFTAQPCHLLQLWLSASELV